MDFLNLNLAHLELYYAYKNGICEQIYQFPIELTKKTKIQKFWDYFIFWVKKQLFG